MKPKRRGGVSAPTPGEVLLYQTEDGQTKLETRFAGSTVWLSLAQLADLFQRDRSVISRHIKNIFESGELKPEATVAFLQQFNPKERGELPDDWSFSTWTWCLRSDIASALTAAFSFEPGRPSGTSAT